MRRRSREVVVLLSPTAGPGRQVTAALAALGSADWTVRMLEAHTIEDAQSACRAAVADGVAALVAAGGDGTVHLAVQAVAGNGVPLGIVPAGTGNDFATCAGVPVDPVAAAKAIVNALGAGRTRAVDLAHVTGPEGHTRWFAAVLGAGFDAIVNERANAMRWPKGPRRYDVAIVLELIRLSPRRYRITLDGETVEQDAVLVAIANTASYGGGMRICPDADLTDGLLDVLVAGPMSRATLLSLRPRVHKGTHVGHRAVRTYRAGTVEVAADGITAYADGERICPLPITVTAISGALTLLV
jgi:diacylglycerol kinase (ATP)